MANYNYGIDLPFTASGDLSSHQYKFVQMAQTAGKVLLATGGCGPTFLGVLQNNPESGEAAEVRIFGSTKLCIADSTIGVGDFVECASTGEGQVLSACCIAGIATEAITGCGYANVVLARIFAEASDNTP